MKESDSQENLIRTASCRRAPSLKRSSRMSSHEFETVRPDQKVLTPDEKMFLLHVERGDSAMVNRLIQAFANKKNMFDIDCVDPLGRSALIITVENENLDMMRLLLENNIRPKDALLVAIREDYVEGVELLLQWEEDNHKPDTLYSWESIDQVTANFTPDITPLILAAQRNNYEILKLLLDRGATIPMPHDVKCSCEVCVEGQTDDSLRFSLSRINSYKALSSPSLIALSSKDPILTAFELGNELKKLSILETEFRQEYRELRKQIQTLATGLVDHARTSYELEILLNHDPTGVPWEPGKPQTLERLKLAIEANQKAFVAHPSVQQLLAAIWYRSLPGFRRLHFIKQIFVCLKIACMFPIYSMFYMIVPNSTYGKFAKSPFIKFLCHSASFMFFLFLLALASQRIEYIIIDVLVFVMPGLNWLTDIKLEWIKHERGALPTIIELCIIGYIQGLVWKELKKMFQEGLLQYLMNLWNLADLFSYGSFMAWIGLRGIAFFIVKKEEWDEIPPEKIWIPREDWHPFSPMLLAEGMFGAGMISSFLKVIQIFSINPYLGPLQVSLGKMIIDIAKWLVLYILVLFSFGCGLNQLLWYYADLEKQKCYSLPGGFPDLENEGDTCVSWRRFSNLWETSQSLFWASFGLVDLEEFELSGIKEFTRFWGLLMFGSYSVCNIIVLLNMLIAMMSNSYTTIEGRSDVEWKFARSRLWISYFEEGATVPPPFNIIPTLKSFKKILKCDFCKDKNATATTNEERKAADKRYYGVVRCLVKRYVTEQQRKSEDFNITEDDINEVRQDIRSFRYELIDILKMNDMKTPNVKDKNVIGRRSKDLERMITKGFTMAKVEGVMTNMFEKVGGSNKQKDLFRRIVKSAVSRKSGKKKIVEEPSFDSSNPIGSAATSIKRKNASFRKSLLMRGNSHEEVEKTLLQLNTDPIVNYNPLLANFTPATRIAYAKFKGNLTDILFEKDEEETPQVELLDYRKVLERKDELPSPSHNNKIVVSLENEIESSNKNQTGEEKEYETSGLELNKPAKLQDFQALKVDNDLNELPHDSSTINSKSFETLNLKVDHDKEPTNYSTNESMNISSNCGIKQIKKSINLDEFLENQEDDDESSKKEYKGDENAEFKTKGTSVVTGRAITGWI